jgi:DedD protein
MAFFKLRLPGRLSSGPTGADALSNTPAESVEVIRKRARHRLMGSVVLVLGAVVGLPLLFDSQPRPVAIDTPIVIPDRNQVAPLTAAVAPKTGTVKEPTPVQAEPAPPETATVAKSAVANPTGLDPNEEVVSKTTKPEPKSEPKPEPKPEPKVEAKPEVKTDAKPDGKEAPKSEQPVRSVVQVGAYAELAKAREVRAKLESAGFKTYTQEVETKDGKRIRVRVGPFPSKEEAEKTAEKIRKLNLQTSVLKL